MDGEGEDGRQAGGHREEIRDEQLGRAHAKGRRVMRSDLELTPLVKGRDQDDVVPEDENWKPVPGLPGVRWRKSKDTFDKGTKGPLYYEVAIALRD